MFQKKILIISVPLTILFTHIPASIAEVVRVPVGEQASAQPAVDMPTRGMTKERVRGLFGEPQEEIPGKGQPPIMRWKYQEFTVYFDGNVVLHCVRNFKPKAQTDGAQ